MREVVCSVNEVVKYSVVAHSLDYAARSVAVPAKENVPLPRVTPVRPVALGSGVRSAKRGLTVASKPCTLVVQRSNKKPTQVRQLAFLGTINLTMSR